MSNKQQTFISQDKITGLDIHSRRSETRRAIPQNSYYEANWIQQNNNSKSTNYEKLARGRFNFDKRIIKPQESRSRESYEVEDTFVYGTNRIVSRHTDRNWKPLPRRTPLLIDRELLPIN